MALKDNIDFVKNEISSEEKFLEGFVRTENFFKRYRTIIIASVIVVIVAVVGYNVNSYNNEENKIQANIAFNKILENPNDKEALLVLENNNKTLFDLAKYVQANKEGKAANTNVKFLRELAMYQEALKTSNVEALNSVSMKNDFLLKEFAIFNKALILAQNAQYEEAKNTLKLIKSDSKVNELASLLNHYLITK